MGQAEIQNDPIVYVNGIWCRQSAAAVPFMDSGFWFGDGLFETIKVNNGRLFRPDKHLARMRTGLERIHMTFPQSEPAVIGHMEELIRRNELQQALIRLMCTRGTITGAPWLFTGPANLYIGLRYSDNHPALPVKVEFVRESDYPIMRYFPAIKPMTYLGNMLAIRDAVSHGAFEPVFVNRDNLITECAVRNIFFIKERVLRTADVNLGVLPGVTRDLVLEIAHRLELEIDTSPIPYNTVNTMDEAFISSTGIGVYPCTWDGFESDYSLTNLIRAEVEAQVLLETGDRKQQ